MYTCEVRRPRTTGNQIMIPAMTHADETEAMCWTELTTTRTTRFADLQLGLCIYKQSAGSRAIRKASEQRVICHMGDATYLLQMRVVCCCLLNRENVGFYQG